MRYINIILICTLVASCGGKKGQHADIKQIEDSVEKVVGIGKIIPEGGINELSSPISGIVASVNVREGDKVDKGDLIISLENSDINFSLKETTSRIQTKKQSILSAKLLLEQEKMNSKEKLRILQDTKELNKAGAASLENVKTAQHEYDLALSNTNKLENDIHTQTNELTEIEVERQHKQNDFDLSQLTSTIEGTILSILVKEGEAVNLHEKYAVVAPDRPLIAIAEIDELFANKLTVNQKCEIRNIGDNRVIAKGVIYRISPDLKKKSLFNDNGKNLEDRRIREIQISLEEIKSPLLINMKVECSVMLK